MKGDDSRPEAEIRTDSRRTCRVISEYNSPYTDPVAIRAGEELAITAKETSWSGWVWCTNRDGKSRWVPDRCVEQKGDSGVALYDYEATELSVSVGEELTTGEEESGWIWCTNKQGRSGWVPADRVERLQ